MYHVFSIHPLVGIWDGSTSWICELCCYKHGDLVNSLICRFHFVCIYSQEWDGWSYGRSIFRYLRNFHVLFHSGCTNLFSHQEWIRAPFPHILPCAYWFLFLYVSLSHISNVVFIWVSLIAREPEQFFVCILVISISFLEKNICFCALSFLTRLLVLLLLSFWSSL